MRQQRVWQAIPVSLWALLVLCAVCGCQRDKDLAIFRQGPMHAVLGFGPEETIEIVFAEEPDGSVRFAVIVVGGVSECDLKDLRKVGINGKDYDFESLAEKGGVYILRPRRDTVELAKPSMADVEELLGKRKPTTSATVHGAI